MKKERENKKILSCWDEQRSAGRLKKYSSSSSVLSEVGRDANGDVEHTTETMAIFRAVLGKTVAQAEEVCDCEYCRSIETFAESCPLGAT